MNPARHLRVDLAYDGTDFAGWQRQAGPPTLQETVEGVLGRINGDRPVVVRAAGRTDAGTHARQQVIDFWLESPDSEAEILHAMQRMLPETVRPYRILRVADQFHPRHAAIRKEYRYVIDRSESGDPFRARYSWHYAGPLEEASMQRAITQLVGRHDWSGFTAAHCEVEDRVRTLERVELLAEAQVWTFRFVGEGFLTFMVRNLVGTLVEIGRGRFACSRIQEILESRDRSLAGPTAPARGLTLHQIEFDPTRA